MSLEAPFRLRSPSKQFDLIVTLDGRVVLYDNNLKKIVDTYVETTKAGPYVLAMKKNCQLAYLTNFKVDVELTGSGTCFAAVRDNG